VTSEQLPEKMSGVLCRCTGYRNIMDAVAEVAEAHPDQVPPPRNCASAALLPRTSVGGRASSSGAADETTQAVAEIQVPQSEPTVAIEVTDDVAADVDAVWEVMGDTDRLARCLPGAELIADFGDDRYKGRIRVALGPVKLAFIGDIHVVERDSASRTIRALAQAKDAGGGSVQADVTLNVGPGNGSGSVINATAGLHMTGRIAQFGRSLAGDVSRDMFQQFTTALDATARGEEPTTLEPPSAVSMAAQLAASRARAAFRRLTRRN
ncbi:MAG TPA: SRPBCC domain-containing protein, partial [Brevibacterium sp.]|nr:SRPBCC domain-containing protein [Brevibacterium sp.]